MPRFPHKDQLSFDFAGRYYAQYRHNRVEDPELFEELVALARACQRKGFTKLGMRMLWEVTRFRRIARGIKRKSGEKYMMNDHLAPYYVREMIEVYPDLKNLFEVRGLK